MFAGETAAESLETQKQMAHVVDITSCLYTEPHWAASFQKEQII